MNDNEFAESYEFKGGFMGGNDIGNSAHLKIDLMSKFGSTLPKSIP